MDISKFYPSINHDILFSIVQRKIKCPDTLRLIKDIIYSVGGGGAWNAQNGGAGGSGMVIIVYGGVQYNYTSNDTLVIPKVAKGGWSGVNSSLWNFINGIWKPRGILIPEGI